MEDEGDIIYDYIRGHEVFSPDDGYHWVWADTQEPVCDNGIGEVRGSPDNRECARCGMTPTKQGHDYCCHSLPGVRSACCGHGVERPYIQFEDDATFADVVNFLKYRQDS